MDFKSSIPPIRVNVIADVPIRPDGEYVLYWMIASRRTQWNFALQRAIEWATELRKPLLVLEALRLDYPWASERFHRFVIDGMADNAHACKPVGISYYPYIEPSVNAGKGLLGALSESAAVVVTDEFPCFMLPRMVAAAAARINTRMEAVDGNGLLPLRATNSRVYPTAYAFRRFMQKTLPDHLKDMPLPNPMRGAKMPTLASLPKVIVRRWPPAVLNEETDKLLAGLQINSSANPVSRPGGSREAAKGLKRFLTSHLEDYGSGRVDLDQIATSGLSGYLHFGHISTHEIFSRIARRQHWTQERLATKAHGRRAGWWGMDVQAEAFLDQLVVWRELGYNMTFHRPEYDRFESLPPWAQQTLNDHAGDERAHVYPLPQFEAAETHDPLWNAAQTQLRTEGVIHNYLRMLWGKKILEWSRSPQEALAIMIELNNKYALDGRNPNSYSGIFWVLGRYDRPWGPERPIFGKIRYMSSENTARKMRVQGYIKRYGRCDA